jgi:hypothetical protein
MNPHKSQPNQPFIPGKKNAVMNCAAKIETAMVNLVLRLILNLNKVKNRNAIYMGTAYNSVSVVSNGVTRPSP